MKNLIPFPLFFKLCTNALYEHLREPVKWVILIAAVTYVTVVAFHIRLDEKKTIVECTQTKETK